MEKRTPEELDRLDRFDKHYRTASALLDGTLGIVTSEEVRSMVSAEILIYEIEDHMEEIKKVFQEVTGQKVSEEEETENG